MQYISECTQWEKYNVLQFVCFPELSWIKSGALFVAHSVAVIIATRYNKKEFYAVLYDYHQLSSYCHISYSYMSELKNLDWRSRELCLRQVS